MFKIINSLFQCHSSLSIVFLSISDWKLSVGMNDGTSELDFQHYASQPQSNLKSVSVSVI